MTLEGPGTIDHADVMAASDAGRLAASLRLVLNVSSLLAEVIEPLPALQRVAELVVPAFADGFAVELEDEHLRYGATTLGAVGQPSAFACELQVSDRCYGTLRLVRTARPIDAADRALFAVLAQRCAFAIDSAQRLAREHHVAETLQRALLPDALPPGSSQRFDAAYRAATQEAIVGGDWYDAFPLPDGRIAFSIGDVAGHGLPAAIVMGEVRQAFRAAALDPKSPSLVLERANRIVNMRSTPVMVTALFGILEPATSSFTYACAGHPAPVLALADGIAEVLPGGGLPLGIADAVDADDWTFTVPPGALLACYTDGITEHSHDVIAGESALLDALRREVIQRNPRPARSLIERVFGSAQNTDDAAVLIVATDDVFEPDFFFEFSAIPFAVPLARHALRRYAERAGFGDDRTFALVSTVGEAVANAVEHAYGRIVGNVRVRVRNRGTALDVSVEDQGRWKPAEKREERGRGLPLMRALADGVEIRTDQLRTLVHLTLSLAPPA